MNLLDLIYPKDVYCISCGRPLPVQQISNSRPYEWGHPRHQHSAVPIISAGLSLCERCIAEIDWLGAESALPSKGHSYGAAIACALYSNHISTMVCDFKFQNKSWNADTMAALMAARYLAEADPETGELPVHDYVVHVPMNAAKKAVRGFDQSELLARGLAHRIGVPHAPALARVRKTEPMSHLSGNERRQNLVGAFAVPCDMIEAIKGKRLLLTDDIYTTGTSADTCTETLLAAGANQVDVIVFATAVDVRRREDRPAVVESPSQLRAKGPT